MPDRPPPERTRTDRDALRDALLLGQPMTARELSQMAGLSEDAVYQHLPHLVKSAKSEGATLEIEPAECLKCGFVFEDRKRFTRPGKCPECKETRISPPSFRWIAD